MDHFMSCANSRNARGIFSSVLDCGHGADAGHGARATGFRSMQMMKGDQSELRTRWKAADSSSARTEEQ